MNHELPDVQAGCRKCRGTKTQIANICWLIEKARDFQEKKSFWLCQSLWLCGSQQWKFLREGIPDHLTSWAICMQVKKQQLELDMEQPTGSKLGKEYVRAVYYHPASVQFNLVAQSCLTLCNPMDCNTPDLPGHHQLLELTQTNVHWVGDAIQPSHPLSSPSPPTLNLSQHQGLFKWVSSSC